MTQINSQQFLFLLHGGKSHLEMSPEDFKRVQTKYLAWFDALIERGAFISSEPLEESGKYISGMNGSIVTDGPFAESKETIGGYAIVKARDWETAIELARLCPIFDNGGVVEIRPILQTMQSSQSP